MKTRWTVVALFLGSALGAAQDAPAPDKGAQDVTMTCKVPPARDKSPRLTLNGTANFPEGTVLKMTLTREIEIFAGSRLTASSEMAGGGLVEVKGKKFQYMPIISGPGAFHVLVQFADDFQKPAILESLKGKVTTRLWNFRFSAWGDELIGMLGPKLAELDAIATECLDIVKRVEKQSGSESSWIKERKNVDARGADIILTKEAEEIVKDTSKLMMRLERLDAKALFPATQAELFYSIRTMHGNSLHFAYEAGKFAGAKSYHTGGDKLKTHRNEEFSFENLRKYVEDAVPLAGREMALWIVKDLRRTDGQMRADITEALKLYAQHPGLAGLSDRLAKATKDDLNAFEEEIRGKKTDAKPEGKPDAKPEPKK
jgi:hypothetical protein